eukprot:875755-Rhodomonas_salina.1
MEDYQYGLWEKNNGECVEKMNASLDQMYLVQLAMGPQQNRGVRFLTVRVTHEIPALQTNLGGGVFAGRGVRIVRDGCVWERLFEDGERQATALVRVKPKSSADARTILCQITPVPVTTSRPLLNTLLTSVLSLQGKNGVVACDLPRDVHPDEQHCPN